MKAIKNPIQKVRLLTVLMIIYFALYLAAIVIAVLSVAILNAQWLLIIAAVCGIVAVGLDIYVRTARSKLNAQLKAEFAAAGVDISKIDRRKKNRK